MFSVFKKTKLRWELAQIFLRKMNHSGYQRLRVFNIGQRSTNSSLSLVSGCLQTSIMSQSAFSFLCNAQICVNPSLTKLNPPFPPPSSDDNHLFNIQSLTESTSSCDQKWHSHLRSQVTSEFHPGLFLVVIQTLFGITFLR